MAPNSVAVILCGGSGERLWPLTGPAMPKPCVELDGEPLLQQALELATRCVGRPAVRLFGARGQLERIAERTGLPTSALWNEPRAEGTARAVRSIAQRVREEVGDVAILVLSADLFTDDIEAFTNACCAALRAAADGALVSIGVPATQSDSGLGYMECVSDLGDGHASPRSL